MTLMQAWRRKLKAPSVLLAAVLMAACASTPARPPVQIGTGDPRAEPVTGEPTELGTQTGETEISGLEELETTPEHAGLTPAFMAGEDIQRAVVMLPFSHPNANVRAEAEGMLAGVELALFEYADDNFLIIPKDTAGRQSVAEARIEEAVSEQADIVIGPLYGANVKKVREIARQAQIPVIGFSNDRTAAGGGAYLASIFPDEEVRRVMEFAVTRGVRRFVYLGPNSAYGRQVEAAMRLQAPRLGVTMQTSAFYPTISDADPYARSIAAELEPLLEFAPSGEVAIMIPERGVDLLSVAPLLPYHGVDLRKVKLLGTSLWDDPSIWREPTLAGGLYATPDPANLAGFRESYERLYGRTPSDLTALAYDAAALSVRLGQDDNLRYGGITDPDGFYGVNGLFRFNIDGTSQRGLAVMEIRPEGAKVIEQGLTAFPTGPS